MGKKYEVQYIRLYTDGNAARKIAPALPEIPQKARPRKRRRVAIYIDPVAMLGIATAVVMLVCMLVGAVQLHNAHQEAVRMEKYVAHLSSENAWLQAKYKEGYKLEEIEEAARALGLVPADEVTHITLEIPQQETQDKGLLDTLTTFLTGLFA